MRTRLTCVQLAILETKRSRTIALMQQVDAVHREASALLALDADRDGQADCCLADFLSGMGETEDLVGALGLEVTK